MLRRRGPIWWLGVVIVIIIVVIPRARLRTVAIVQFACTSVWEARVSAVAWTSADLAITVVGWTIPDGFAIFGWSARHRLATLETALIAMFLFFFSFAVFMTLFTHVFPFCRGVSLAA